MRHMDRRCLALWFPWLPCERAARTMGQAPAPHDAPAPLVLVAREGNAMRLSAVDPVAERQGLHIGMTLADARARCPTLRSLPADPAADAQELERLSALMERFTPMVALDPPDGLLLDISGCAHLFGGERQLADYGRNAEDDRRTTHTDCRELRQRQNADGGEQGACRRPRLEPEGRQTAA